MPYRIMIVEDDATIAGEIADHLRRYGYEPDVAADFSRVEQHFLESRPHLVLMDVNLPYQDGFHLTRAIRRHSSAPILFLSARAGDMEQVFGMESGGDDYVTKPFHLEVLLAKIRALLRRSYGEYALPDPGPRTVVRVGALELDLTGAELRRGDRVEALSRNELKLLHLLMEQAGRVVSRERCLEALWDDSAFVDDNTLAVNVNRVRARLDAVGLKEALQTRRGLGYILLPEKLGEAP